jgi:polysaccharide export outer membrane protein
MSCASSPPVKATQLPSAVRSKQADEIPRELLDATIGGRDDEAYRVGPGDTVLIAVFGHPELSIAQYAGGSLNVQGARLAGLVVDNDGTVQFPLVGSVRVSGKTSAELRSFLEQELATYVKEPKVTVQVVFTGSIRYYLLGQFTNPGVKYSDRPMRLLEALSLGGSVILDKASLHTAYLARHGKRLPINFRRLVREGDLSQNIKLETGDLIMVPDNAGDLAFVFGGSSGSNPMGGAVPFMNGRLNLLQALARAGFGFRERVQAKLSEVRVIRSEGDRGELFVVDAERIVAGEAAPFELVPGDIVFVPTTALTDWNQALEQLLPSLQTVSGLLSPFVQMKYLSQ